MYAQPLQEEVDTRHFVTKKKKMNLNNLIQSAVCSISFLQPQHSTESVDVIYWNSCPPVHVTRV